MNRLQVIVVKDAHGVEWTLRHQTGSKMPVCKGDIVEDFRGEKDEITGGEPPGHVPSTGRVYTAFGGSFYPSVYKLEWVKS